MLSNLGIIAGSGDLPIEIARLQKESGGKCVVAVLDPKNSFEGFEHKHFALGAVGGVLDYFKENSVEEIIIVGGVNRPDFKFLKVDFSGSVLVAKILKQKFLGDDNVIKIVANYIESKGFKVISPKKILKTSKNFEIISSKKKPSSVDGKDIEMGKQILKSLGSLDVGQSVIVCNGYVVGIEAAEGTDNLIDRCSVLRKQNKGGVLVKMSKSSQDMRFDIPVIGPGTVARLVKNEFSGVAVEKEGVIIINPVTTKRLLDENKMFLFFI